MIGKQLNFNRGRELPEGDLGIGTRCCKTIGGQN